MAKRRRRTATRAGATKIIRMNSPAPIIRVAAPRAAIKHRRRRARSHGGGTHAGGLVSNESFQMAIGGVAYGFAMKSGLVAKLPEIPILGRTGTAAIILDYWSRHGGGRIVRSAAHAAAAIAGYQLGAEGKISGDFAMGDATTPGSLAGDSAAEGDSAEGDDY